MTGELTVIVGRGHSAIRASHGKTLELTPDAELGAGGTCIVAVSSSVAGAPIAGAIRCDLQVGGVGFTFDAQANPDWDPTGPAVIRRSEVRKSDTLATHATASAADLPADLRAALTNPDIDVRLSIWRRPERERRLVLVASEPSAAQAEAADAVFADGSLPSSGRVLVRGERLPAGLRSAGETFEVVDLAEERAVAVASDAAAVRGDLDSLADPQLAERAVVLRIPAAELPRVVRQAHRNDRRTGAIVSHLPWVRWGPLDHLHAQPGARMIWVCVDAAAAITDEDIASRLAELFEAGTATKPAARIVAAELGVPVNRAYEIAVSGRVRFHP